MMPKNGLGKTLSDAAINITACGAGGTVATYVIKHDAMNDEKLSVVAGVGTGFGTFYIIRGLLMTAMDAGSEVVNAILGRKQPKTRINSGNKNSAGGNP